MSSLWRSSGTLAAGIGAALILVAPSLAEARTEVLRWTHPDPGSVASFTVVFGTASRSYGAPVDAGKPAPDAAGVYSFSLQVPAALENEPLYIALTAIGGDGRASPYSNEKIRAPVVDTSPPTITASPVDLDVLEGGTAGFQVQAAGTGPLGYQWQRNGANLQGEISFQLTLQGVGLADDGALFRCIVTNNAGSVTTGVARLTVTAAPDSDPIELGRPGKPFAVQ